MDPTLLDALDRGDVGAAVDWIAQEDDPLRVVTMSHEAMRHLYWRCSNIAAVVQLAQTAIDNGLLAATELDDASSRRVRGGVKAIAYDLASFTWPGWDQPGITIGPGELAAGAAAASLNLELALALGRDVRAVASAHWIVGAHHLAAERWDEARSYFASCIDNAPDRGFELLGRGYDAIASGDGDRLEAVIAACEDVEDGPEYIEQLRVASRVFSS